MIGEIGRIVVKSIVTVVDVIVFVSLAALYEATITRGLAVDPEALVVTSGVGALIAAMAYLLCDEGDWYRAEG